MQFRLLHTEVPKLQFEKIEAGTNQDENTPGFENYFDLGLNLFSDDLRKDVFAVMFKVKLTHHHEFKLFLDYLVWFETTEEINSDFLSSPLAQVNAPAIAFPYLRSFVSLLTLNSGFRPAILPTVNFLKMFEGQKEVNR